MLRTYPPGAAVDAYVEYYWHVAWDVPGGDVFEAQVLPHPHVHLVFERPAPLVYGVDRGLFTRRLRGRGQVLGVRFHAGAFRAFAGGPVGALTDRRIPAASVFGDAVDRRAEEILALADGPAMARAAEAFLTPLLPPGGPDPAAVRAARAVGLAVGDPSLVRVSGLAEATGLSVRALQRLFAEYVGVSPKWTLRRARLHEAAARADSGEDLDWAALAADLGYADQAHLTRDFAATLGAPPSRYVR